MKSHYSAKELNTLGCVGGASERTIKRLAQKENWQSRPRQGKGGGVEYSFDGLPKEVQTEIKSKELKALMTAPSTKGVAVSGRGQRDVDSLTHKDRRIADARLLMALLVEQYALELGTQDKAIKHISKLSRLGALPVDGSVDYNEVCENAKASNRGVGVGVRKLHAWVLEARQCETPSDRLSVLSPAKQGRPELNVLSVVWLPQFLKIYRNPNGLSVSRCYELWRYDYIREHGTDMGLPSICQVRTVLKRIPPLERERGRMTGSALKAIDSYVRRDWNNENYANNHIWVGDGHSLKMSVKHHRSGQAVTPELTLIIDAPSRYIVGYSLSYSESGMSVLSALRYAWARQGVNAIYYSDNGRGQKNIMLDDKVVGILARLGITHMTGIPGNPQGRAIIERLMKEVPKRVAQSFESYHGKDGDPDTLRKRGQAKLAYNKANSDGKVTGEMTALQRKGEAIVPTMSELREVVESLIDEYNNVRKHRSIGMTPSEKRAELDRVHGGQRVWLSELDLRELAVQVVERVASRGWVRYDNRFYFSQELVAWDGQKVYLYANDDSLSDVMVREKDGVYICTAILEGNQTPAVPLDLLEQAEQRRVNQAIKRKENQTKQLKQQLQGKAIIEAKAELLELGSSVIDAQWTEIKTPVKGNKSDDTGFVFYDEIDWHSQKRAV